MTVRAAWKAQRDKDRAAVEDYAAHILHDTRWDGLRTRPARRLLVVGLTSILVATLVTFVTVGSWGIIPLGLAIVLWVLLRLSVRTIADLPDELLDERQVALRNDTYRAAFLVLGSILLTALLAVLVWTMFAADDTDSIGIVIGVDDVFGVFWFTLGLCLALPSMMFAWTQSELDQ